ncbi:hypothetical protein O3M35_000448 [Rhynocoris fuscipes]|uniref:VASt domain-containing protein n=1 Tax=Rhynocoris fuscipes TaxID=488301 RepID=A0AAW1DM77_9HEMI
MLYDRVLIRDAYILQPMSTQEMWQWVHTCYGDELGLTSDDDDYIAPSATEDDRPVPSPKCDSNSLDSYSVEDQVFVSVGEKESEDHEERLDTLPSPGPQPPTPGSPSENLPTDLSDSSVSESGSDKHGCLISCPVLHEGRLMLHMQVSIHVDQLFTHLFTNSKFFFDLHENRKSTDVKQSPWVTNPSTNQKGRTVSHTMPLGQAIGPKSAQITESQKMLPCSKPGEIYAIETEACNAGVPYAEAFYVSCHYCLTRGADPNTSTIAVYSQIKYRKSVWGLVKGYIEKNCWAGMEEYFSYLVKALEKECERTRRAMASGIVGTKRKVSRRRRSTALKSLPLPVCPVPVEEKPLIQPLQLPTQPPVNTQPDTLLWIVFIVLFFLLVLNAALYYKLWGLERNEQLLSSATHELDLEAMRNIPQNTEEWKTLLLKQEKLHSVEVGKWLRILKASVHLLQQVEHSLSALQSSIQGIMGENLYSAIKENSGADSSHSTDDL